MLPSVKFAEDKVLVFTALHGMQMRSSDEISVCPSVCLNRMVGRGDPFYLIFLVNRPRWGEIAVFEWILARSAPAVTPSEKKLN